ncbi:MAG: hypothetical protein ACYTGH_06985 [Planctomycetota bacterium]|jgi:hypothetical protein
MKITIMTDMEGAGLIDAQGLNRQGITACQVKEGGVSRKVLLKGAAK